AALQSLLGPRLAQQGVPSALRRSVKGSCAATGNERSDERTAEIMVWTRTMAVPEASPSQIPFGRIIVSSPAIHTCEHVLRRRRLIDTCIIVLGTLYGRPQPRALGVDIRRRGGRGFGRGRVLHPQRVLTSA